MKLLGPKTVASKRFNLVDHEDYTIDLEYNHDYAIIHLPWVKKFTKTYYLIAYEKLTDIKQFMSNCGYNAVWTAVYPEDALTNKFVKKLGFEFVGKYENLNVYISKDDTWDQ